MADDSGKMRGFAEHERTHLTAPHPDTTELGRWRSWAQFVFLNGGPVTLNDDQLRAAVCEAWEKETAELKQRIAFLEDADRCDPV